MPDRGKVLTQGRDREAREIPSLSRRGRRRHPVPHAAGRASEGRVLHARLGPHAVRRLHRGFGRIPDRARPADAQVRTPRSGWCRKRRHRAATRTSTSRSWPTAAPTARCARRSTSSRARASRPTTCACASFPFGEEVEKFLERAQAACSSSSRTATRRCARC